MATVEQAKFAITKLPPEERREFIGKFNALDTEQQKVAMDRLVTNVRSVAQEQINAIPEKPKPTPFIGIGKEFDSGERSTLGNIFERPGAAVRGGILGTLRAKEGQSKLKSFMEGYKKGALTPEKQERFQNVFLDNYYNSVNPESGLSQALGLGVSTAGLAADIITQPADLLAMVVGKAPGMQNVARTIGGSKVGQVVKSVATHKFTPGLTFKNMVARYAPSYVKTNVFPRFMAAARKNILAWGDDVQRYAVKELKVPVNAANRIKERGVVAVKEVRQRLGDSMDEIYQKVSGGFKAKHDEANTAFANAWSEIPNGSIVDARKTLNTIKTVLTENGLLAPNGKFTPAYKNRAVQDSTLGKLGEVYKLLTTKKDAKGQVTKEIFQLFKSTLDDVPTNNSSYAKFIRPVRNSIYDDAADMGTDAIKIARDKYRVMSEMEDRYLNSMDDFKIREKKLDRIHKASKQELRDLESIQEYTGVEFLDDAKDLAAARELDKLDDIKIDSIAGDLQKSTSPKDNKFIKDKYVDLIGEKDADKIFRDTNISGKAEGKKKFIKWAGITIGGAYLAKKGLQTTK